MKDIIHTRSRRGWVFAAISYTLFSVLPALLILRYVIQINLAIMTAVLVSQAVLFIILRKKLYETAAVMVSAVRGLLESSPCEIQPGQDSNVTEVILEKQEMHSLCFLMFWITGMSAIGLDALLPWAIELRFSLVDLWKLIGGLIALFVIHEALHGIAAMAWGKVPFRSLHFGINVRLMAFYCHADQLMTLSAYRAVALLPLIATTPAAVLILSFDPAIWSVLLLCATFAGGAGDVMVFFKARRYDNDSWIQDHLSEVGFTIFPAGETPAR
ncbi:MAG: DUF3267 domain-containing protein [Gemmatimonadota bacterium]|nr:DUF3267 domain-containing protein [Gemmatimonadota bacterium]